MQKKKEIAVGAPLAPGLLYTVFDIARLLRVSEGTIRAWVLKKQIPYIKVGKGVRFSQASIDAYLNRNTVQPRVDA